mmetsp:Transcript_10411/g.43267  ORF Transcript_10411/g.43267 Transcript_10411/m.43267 type:complete len:84 (+) Transcript_10411:191-442(+)
MRKVHVRMPRFKVQFQTSVKDTLRSIGIEAVFTQLGMLKGICTREDTFIGDVVHKAMLRFCDLPGRRVRHQGCCSYSGHNDGN